MEQKKKINPLVIILIVAFLLVGITVLVVRFVLGYNYTTLGNGGKFVGEYENGQPIKGTINYADGISGELDLLNRTITYSNGDLYEGDIKNGLRDGNGKLTRSATGDVYVGQFKDDEISGKGTFTYSNGDVYEGELLNSQKHGQGKFTYANGNVYEGQFANDVRSGKGRFTWASGTHYEGDFAEDLKNGYGVMVFENGDRYEGYFKNDMREGENCIYIWNDGERYNGAFIANLMDTRKRDGEGNFILDANGEYTHGEMGIYTFSTGRTYRGYFMEGKAIGVSIEG